MGGLLLTLPKLNITSTLEGLLNLNSYPGRLERYLVDWIQISVCEEGEVPDDGEPEPAEEEPGSEEEEDPAPVEVNERDEDVLEGSVHRNQDL